jgi:hypothetical protein
MANLHKTQAETDFIQAQAVKTLGEAGLTPTGELIQQAEEPESASEGNGSTEKPRKNGKNVQTKLNPVSELTKMHTNLGDRLNQTLDMHGKTLESLNTLTAEMKRKKKVVRDSSGRVAGIE